MKRKMENREIMIEQLMIEKLAGIISPEDSIYLDDILRSGVEIKQKWEDLKASFEVGEPNRFLESINTENSWTHFERGIAEKKQKRTILISKLTIAASLMIPLFLVSLFLFNSKTSTKNKIAQLKVSDRSVRLYLNGSASINLSNYSLTSGVSTLKNVKLNISKGSLSYVILKNEDQGTLNTLVIPETQIFKVTLSDGTEVWLNSLSQLKFPFVFSREKREVWVNGEAYFKVAKNPYRPFIVHTSLTDIKVLGTEFNVNTYDSLQINVALIHGSVSTSSKSGQSILLKPGFQVEFGRSKQFNVTDFDSSKILSWMKGIYFFQNSSLTDLATVIYRWYGETLVFDNPKLSSSHFTGALFKDKSLKDFLDNLSLTSNISYQIEGNIVHLTSH
jgi:transmembrane sensor